MRPVWEDAEGERVKPSDFKKWRKALDYSQKDAAEALGLKRRVVQYYEKGERNGEEVRIPRTVQLACAAIWHALEEWPGPQSGPPQRPAADVDEKLKPKAKAGKKDRKADKSEKTEKTKSKSKEKEDSKVRAGSAALAKEKPNGRASTTRKARVGSSGLAARTGTRTRAPARRSTKAAS